MNTSEEVTYYPLSSAVQTSFWTKLTELKLDVDKLEEKERHIWGHVFNANPVLRLSLLQVDSTSFNNYFVVCHSSGKTSIWNCEIQNAPIIVNQMHGKKHVLMLLDLNLPGSTVADIKAKINSLFLLIPGAPSSSDYCLCFHGTLINKNTIESFKDCNKNELISKFGGQLVENIKNGAILEKPALLNNFFLLTFADLKKYHYYYWFAFPVPSAIHIHIYKPKMITTDFNELQMDRLSQQYKELAIEQKSHFLLEYGQDIQIHTHKSKLKELNSENFSLYYFVFHDTSVCMKNPGTMLRNYILFILYHCDFLQGKDVNFISLRWTVSGKKVDCSDSVIYKLKLPSHKEDILSQCTSGWTGWEKNDEGKNIPKLANMKSTMDPKYLAEQSVDLNLKLMKWQLAPDINLDKIKTTRYLLLGSGTLGCSVARILIGWGARNIVFLDNSIVSYSNPVRQSLFTYEDSKASKGKALAAAENARKIFPGINSEAHQLTIPMPSHPIGQSMKEQTSKDIDSLTNLIENCDVMFILTDSRESRWLPTLLGTVKNKIVINAALGFDSYLIMRHGSSVPRETDIEPPKGFKVIKGHQLGCYFCSDVIAPGDSVKNRTLDQQCTVTRPGVSAIAGAIAAELSISLIHHPLGVDAPAFYKTQDDEELFRDDECILGVVPHTVRGYISSFSQMLPASHKFLQCTACSEIIQNEYREKGKDFLFEVFQSSKHLSDLLKLEDIHNIEVDISSFSEDESI